jgi:hypothetical protein
MQLELEVPLAPLCLAAIQGEEALGQREPQLSGNAAPTSDNGSFDGELPPHERLAAKLRQDPRAFSFQYAHWLAPHAAKGEGVAWLAESSIASLLERLCDAAASHK